MGTPASSSFLNTMKGLEAGGGFLGSLFGSSQTKSGTQRQRTEFRPEDLARIESAMGQMPGQTAAFQTLLSRLGGEARGAAPSLQAQFAPTAGISQFQPQFSTQLDPFSQAVLSQARGDLQKGVGAQAQGAMQRLAGQPGLAGALATIAQIRGAGQANRLPLDVAQQQVGRNMAQQQMLADVQGQFNQQQLQRSAQELQRLVAQNQALGQQFGLGQASREEQAGFGGAGAQAGGNLAQMLAQLGQILGTGVTSSEMKAESPGLLSHIFG